MLNAKLEMNISHITFKRIQPRYTIRKFGNMNYLPSTCRCNILCFCRRQSYYGLFLWSSWNNSYTKMKCVPRCALLVIYSSSIVSFSVANEFKIFLGWIHNAKVFCATYILHNSFTYFPMWVFWWLHEYWDQTYSIHDAWSCHC